MRRLGFLLCILAFACGDDDFTFDGGTDAGGDATLSDSGADSQMSDTGPSDAGDDAPSTDAGDRTDALDPVDAGDDAPPSDAGDDAGPDGGMGCTDDCECAPEGWCRVTMDPEVRTCTPWQLDGEFCGGFTPAWAQTRCDPELTCSVTSPLIPDAPGVCALEVTLAELLANPRMYEGRWIVVRDVVQAGLAFCTRIACPPEMPCCNECSASQVIGYPDSGQVPLVNPDGMPVSCRGNECNYISMCQLPFGETTIIGEFRVGEIVVRHAYM